MICNGRLAHRLHKQLIVPIGDRKAAQIQRVHACRNISERHKILPVRADIHDVVIDGIFVAADRPLQRVRAQRWIQRKAIIDTGFEFRCLLIVVPCHQLQIRKRLAGTVKTICVGKSLQPGLPALLRHHPVRTPRRIFVVEAFVGCANGLLVRKRHAGLVEAGQIGQPIVAGRRHYPGITAIGKAGGETVVVLKNQCRLDAHVRQRCAPTNRGIIQVHVELRQHGLTLKGHVGRRREVSFFDVLQIVHQSLLRRAARAGIPFDGPLIDHDRESEARMSFSLCHDLERGLIDGITRTVPIEDHAIDSAADHVINLVFHLCRTGRVVADIHMVRLAEPENHVGVDLSCRTRIQQGMHIDLADVSGTQVAI